MVNDAKSIREAARDYFRSGLRYTPLVIAGAGGTDGAELQVWRHAGHNDACALYVRRGDSELCFVPDEPAQIEDLIEILQGMLDAIREEAPERGGR